ncbi:pentatricopeptide repeat-containing protein At3g04130, mitochondrial [Brassica napus]|uniref:pentatricopeptide repeat-containing protein At3g04130, mitochondrial n=1 Tax=Brassica napus TaxID=3708 RepID=UPI002078FA80|nr:pentatricopeptide repeat-containing protein At3g04130, mitochondrial [Brassica napus]
MSRLIQNRIGNTLLRLKPQPSILIKNLSTSPEPSLDDESSQSSHIWNVIIARAGGDSEDEVFHRLSNDPLCNRVTLSDTLLNKLLHRFRDDWRSALGVLKWAESRKAHKNHSPEAYDTAVDILGKAKKWDRMKDFVEKMKVDNTVTLNTVAKIMRRFAGAGEWEEAVNVFDRLNEFGLEKNTESMNLLLDTLCKEKRVERARSVLLELKAHIKPDAHTFNIFINGWCKTNRVEEALWTIQEMRGYGFRPCVISYTTIIKCYCLKSDFIKVYEMLSEMEANDSPPNSVTYTTIMSCLNAQKEFEESLRVAARMKRSGCEGDTLFYNCLIHTLARAGRLEEAERVFRDEMPSVNTSTYNSMIAMYCHHDEEEKAVELLREMESLKVCEPDVHTYHPLLRSCFKRGDVVEVGRLLKEMVTKHHLSLDESTYTFLIQRFCRADMCEWAYCLFEEMISQDIAPRHRTCLLLLDEVRKKSMHEAVERIEYVMRSVKLTAPVK